MTIKIKKRWIIFISILLLYLIFSLEYRKFYCLENGKCITVWLRNYTYYVIPYKCCSLLIPKDNYIITKDPNDIDVYWINDSIIVRVSKPQASDYKIINNSKVFKMYDYNIDEKKYEDVIFDGSGRAAVLKKCR